uniref:Uncharacterized protein n=1 Tax=Vespula pensylvanica TaxID=30213 RepID=A0A834UF70_VESPE|nr:hypothetical protein H0235_003980 [Vespula pensylvanica]
MINEVVPPGLRLNAEACNSMNDCGDALDHARNNITSLFNLSHLSYHRDSIESSKLVAGSSSSSSSSSSSNSSNLALKKNPLVETLTSSSQSGGA